MILVELVAVMMVMMLVMMMAVMVVTVRCVTAAASTVRKRKAGKTLLLLIPIQTMNKNAIFDGCSTVRLQRTKTHLK